MDRTLLTLGLAVIGIAMVQASAPSAWNWFIGFGLMGLILYRIRTKP